MKYFSILPICILLALASFGQGKSISFSKKLSGPFVSPAGDTMRVNSKIKVMMGSNTDGSFKYVQLLNAFNEPSGFAQSSAAMKNQTISFFKQQDGTVYVFTKFFVINLEAALASNEVKYPVE